MVHACVSVKLIFHGASAPFIAEQVGSQVSDDLPEATAVSDGPVVTFTFQPRHAGKVLRAISRAV